jgi:hypothetical protein
MAIVSCLRVALLLGVLVGVAPAKAAVDPCTPTDTNIYVAIDLRQAFDSAFFKDNVLETVREVLGQFSDAETVLKDLGLNPFKDIDRVVLASPAAKENDRGLIIARGKFDTAKFKSRADKLKKAKDESVTIHTIPLGGGATHDVYEMALPGQDLSLFVTLLDGSTLLASPGKDYVVDALKTARDKKKSELKNKELAALIARLETSKQALTVAFPGSALAGLEIPGFEGALKGVEAVGGGLTIGKELKLDLAVSSKTEENARELRSLMDRGVKLATAGLALVGEDNKELSLLYEVVKSIKVIGKGKVVGVSARITAETLQDLFGKGG